MHTRVSVFIQILMDTVPSGTSEKSKSILEPYPDLDDRATNMTSENKDDLGMSTITISKTEGAFNI